MEISVNDIVCIKAMLADILRYGGLYNEHGSYGLGYKIDKEDKAAIEHFLAIPHNTPLKAQT